MNPARTALAPRGGTEGEGFPSEYRIRRGAEIEELLRRGKRERTRMIDVFFRAAPVSHSRLGLVVPKFGHTSVARNRVRRRLREIGRRLLLPTLRDRAVCVDVLLRVNRRAYGASFHELQSDVESMMEALWPEQS
ncbi:MAG: ribonuclease P protein component [Longimicrobiales bacterium]|nr:ribonuclease P protein component [Longimicrobiales bacterium]